MALGRYNFKPGTGLYTDMNAIRRDEELDNLHSIYVDQWDWEKAINKEDRTTEYLHEVVVKLYNALKNLNDFVNRNLFLIFSYSFKFNTTVNKCE